MRSPGSSFPTRTMFAGASSGATNFGDKKTGGSQSWALATTDANTTVVSNKTTRLEHSRSGRRERRVWLSHRLLAKGITHLKFVPCAINVDDQHPGADFSLTRSDHK